MPDIVKVLSATALLAVAWGCAPVPRPPPKAPLRIEPLKVDNVSLSSKILSAAKGEKVSIKYRLSGNGRARVRILDVGGRLVREIVDHKSKAGYNAVAWDGKDREGRVVPSEAYTYLIDAESDDGETARYDPIQTGGMELNVGKLAFERKGGIISYVLPKAGRVRIRLGIRDGGPLLRTLVDWEPREGGANTEWWDGKDKNGILDFSGEPKLGMAVSAYSLPDNTIIVRGNPEAGAAYGGADLSRQRLSDAGRNLLYRHARHARGTCHEPRFAVAVSGDQEGDHPFLLNGVVPVKVSLAEADREALTNARYEIAFFVDHVFLFEEEDGFSPYTYMWATRGLNEGEHILTVMVQGYDDHIGTETQKVVIRR